MNGRSILVLFPLVVLTAAYGSPPSGCDGAFVRVDGTQLSVRMMSLSSPEAAEACHEFAGPGYTFMFLTIHNREGVGRFVWNCNRDSLLIHLEDDSRLANSDLTQLDGFFQWDLASYFGCSKIIYPGRIEYIYLVFDREFEWNDVRSVDFQIRSRAEPITAQWIKRDD